MKKIFIAIATLLFLAVIIAPRFSHLGSQPPGLHIDEVSFAADAKAIAETGRDTWNKPWPTVFKAFGEWKAPGLVYSMAIWSKVLGRMDNTVTRLPSAIAGLTILLMLGLTLNSLLPVKKYHWTALAVAIFVLAFSPWHFDMSRIFYESFSALAIFSISLWLMTKATMAPKYSRNTWLAAAALAGFAGYWYASIRYVVIAVLVLAVFVQKWRWSAKLKSGFLLMATLLLVGGFWVKDLASNRGLNRLYYYQNKTSTGATLEIDEKRQYCYLSLDKNPKLAKLCYIIWNKPVSMATGAVKTYATYLGTDFLFVKSISEYGFDSEYGAYLLPLLPLYLVGLFFVLRGALARKTDLDRVYALYVGTALISLIPAAVANNINMRMGLPALYLVGLTIGIGIYHTLVWLRAYLPKLSWLVYLTFAAILGFYIVQSTAHYFLVFTHSNDLMWTSDAGAIFGYVKSVSPQYDHIIDTELHGPLAPYFYSDLTTAEVQNGAHSTPDPFGFTYLTQAGKYELRHANIVDLACEKIGKHDTRRILVITVPNPGLGSVRKFASYSWSGALLLHEVYDLGDVVNYELRTNPNFKATCTPK
jgi:hypothetical protein